MPKPHSAAQTMLYNPDPKPHTSGLKIFSKLGLPQSGSSLHNQLHEGFSFQVYSNLSHYLKMPQKELNKVLQFAPATVERRKKKNFNTSESDTLYRLANLARAAAELFEGNEEKARLWLNKPAKALGGKRPIDMVITSAETEMAINLIGRLEHGVFS